MYRGYNYFMPTCWHDEYIGGGGKPSYTLHPCLLRAEMGQYLMATPGKRRGALAD